MQDISDTILGLKNYEAEVIDEAKMKQYVEFTESHNNPKLNIWSLIWAIILISVNYYGFAKKNNFAEEYQIRKVVESFFSMQVQDMESDSYEGI